MLTRRTHPDHPDAAVRRTLRGIAGFTLMEMIVVVSIILVLLAIAVPVSTGLIKSQKSKATKATMLVLENAISAFSQEKPLDQHGAFGSFPPSPVSAFNPMFRNPEPLYDGDPLFLNEFGPSAFAVNDVPAGVHPFVGETFTKFKFEKLVRLYLAPNGDVPAMDWHYDGDATWIENSLPSDTYLSIETLVLFLNRLSPESRDILAKLTKQTTNLDKDRIAWDADGQTATTGDLFIVDLFEIVDTWGTPMRYAVQTAVRTTDGTMPVRWELRSAGADRKFEPTFDPANPALFLPEDEAGDDVILRGP